MPGLFGRCGRARVLISSVISHTNTHASGRRTMMILGQIGYTESLYSAQSSTSERRRRTLVVAGNFYNPLRNLPKPSGSSFLDCLDAVGVLVC